jgi:tetratricopeptide (TPR) repeat protein
VTGGQPERAGRADFFVSRAGADARWAQWIAWQLEAAGYAVIVQDWDFQPGSNFMADIRRALDAADTTIGVYSPAYFATPFTQDEWTAALVTHEPGEVRFLPVRIADVDIPRLLQPIVYVDLVGLDEPAARSRLLDAAQRRPRTKPLQEPAFPGGLAPAFPLAGAPTGPRVRLVNSAPVDVSRFADRVDEVRGLDEYLHDPGVRLVAVVGRLGMGKSALASQVLTLATQAADGAWPDAVVFLDQRATGLELDRLYADLRRLLDDTTAGRLAETWARTDVTLRESVGALVDSLRGRHVVVVLDGLDGVLDDGVPTGAGLRAFLQACLERLDAPQLLVTSRVDLTVPPEAYPAVRTVRLRQGIAGDDAVWLLKRLDPQGDLGLADAPDDDLRRAVELTGGIPRALELLAGMLQHDPAASLAGLLADDRALGGQVVERLVAEAYGRLGPDEQRVLEVMAVVDAPVTEDAIAFVAATWFPDLPVRPALRRLVASYFATASRGRGEYLLQSADRLHAYQQIPAAPGAAAGPHGGYHRAAAESRVADYYASVRLPPAAWLSIESVAPQLAEYQHRLRAGEVDRALQVLDEIDREHLFLWGHYARLLELRQQALDVPARPALRARNLASLGVVTQVLGQYDAATTYYEQAVACAAEAGDEPARVEYLGHLGRLYRNVGDMDRALACSEQALAAAEQAGDRAAVGRWQDRLGLVDALLGRLAEARRLHEDAVTSAREFADRRSEGAALSNLGVVLALLGEVDAADAAQRDALALSREVADRRGIAIVIGRQGLLAAGRGDHAAALALHQEAWDIAVALGERREQSYQLIGKGRAHTGLGALAEAEADHRAARDLEMPETSYAAALALALLPVAGRDQAARAALFADAARRCRDRLGRSADLFAARYALAVALLGVATCDDGWADVANRDRLLAEPLDELRRALATCAAPGARAAARRDVVALAEGAGQAGAHDGLAPVLALLDAVGASPAGPS